MIADAICYQLSWVIHCSAECRLLALSGHAQRATECLLSEVKRTLDKADCDAKRSPVPMPQGLLCLNSHLALPVC